MLCSYNDVGGSFLCLYFSCCIWTNRIDANDLSLNNERTSKIDDFLDVLNVVSVSRFLDNLFFSRIKTRTTLYIFSLNNEQVERNQWMNLLYRQ